MSVKTITGYQMYCNGCDLEFDAGDGFTVFLGLDQLIETVLDSDWTTDGVIYHCYDCPMLAKCRCCEQPAGDLSGERDYTCEVCWDSMAPDLKHPEDKDGTCMLNHSKEGL